MWCEGLYLDMIDDGVCPEQARMVLPQSMITEWIWSGSLYAFARVCKLRLEDSAQKEVRAAVLPIHIQLAKKFPVSWEALMESE